MIWILVLERVASLEELESFWCLDDALRAHALLEYKKAVEIDYSKHMKEKNNQKIRR